MTLSVIHCGIKTIEKGLKYGSFFPLVGIIPAALLVVVGAVEAAVSLIFAFLSSLICCLSKGARRVLIFSLHHLGDGVLNMLSGACRAIIGPCCGCCCDPFDCVERTCGSTCHGFWAEDESLRRV
jgi:hypothetical protein